MKIKSKCSIYKCDEFYTKDGKRFYIATIVESVKNSNAPTGWEQAFYKAIIFTDKILQPANYGTVTHNNIQKTSYAINNISNQNESVIVIDDFDVTTKTKYKGREMLKDKMGKPLKETLFNIIAWHFINEPAPINDNADTVKRLLIINEKQAKEIEKLKEKIEILKSKQTKKTSKNIDYIFDDIK